MLNREIEVNSERVLKMRELSRKENLHTVLTDEDKYHLDHQALCNISDMMVDAVDDFLDKALSDRIREEGNNSETDAMKSERNFHLEKISLLVVREAIERLLSIKNIR